MLSGFRVEFFLAVTPRQKGNSKRIIHVGRPGAKRPMLVSKPQDLATEREVAIRAGVYKPLRPLEGPIFLGVTFVLQVPPSWTKRRRAEALAGQVLPTSVPDRGNLLKLLEDALQAAGFYKSDSQIVDGHVRKEYGAQPGYRIQFEALVGVEAVA